MQTSMISTRPSAISSNIRALLLACNFNAFSVYTFDMFCQDLNCVPAVIGAICLLNKLTKAVDPASIPWIDTEFMGILNQTYPSYAYE